MKHKAEKMHESLKRNALLQRIFLKKLLLWNNNNEQNEVAF